MENDVEDFFDQEQDKGRYREQYLKVLRTKLGCGYGLHSPLRGRPMAQAANAPDRIQVDQRAGQRQQNHRNADPISVQAPRDAGPECRGQRSKADHQAQPADRHEGRAETL